MAEQGIRFLMNADIESVALLQDGRRQCRFSDGTVVDADVVLCALGRNPNIEGLGLAELDNC